MEPRQVGFQIAKTPDYMVSAEDLERLRHDGPPVFRKMDCVPVSQEFRDLAGDRSIVSFVKDLIGPAGDLFYSATFPKIGGLAREKPWHHDADYWQKEWNFSHDTPENCRARLIVQTMTAIDAHSPKNGGLQVIPGSHHRREAHEFVDGERKVRSTAEIANDAVALELEPGDVLIFDIWLLHASTANRSATNRCASYNAYSTSSLKFKGPGDRRELLRIWGED